MINFTIYTEKTAPAESRSVLDIVQLKYGFIPNLHGVMAESTDLLQGYLSLTRLFSQTTLKDIEKHIVLLSASYENHCEYCMSAHLKIAVKEGVPTEIVECILSGEALTDNKLEALHQFVCKVVATRGFPEEKTIQNLLQSGYTQKNILEVILGIGMKTLSNYTNHIAHTAIDSQFT